MTNFELLNNKFEVLNEVEIKLNKRKSDNHKKVYGTSTMLTTKRMKDLIITPGETIIDYLKYRNYKFSQGNSGNLQISPRGMSLNRGAKNKASTGDEGPLASGSDNSTAESSYGRPNVRVYLDSHEITDNLYSLYGVYLDMVKEISYGRNPGKMGEEIHIFTLSPSEYMPKNAQYTHITIPHGFASEKKYYTPKYLSFTEETYKNYGAIFWKPNIIIRPKSKINFKIPINMQQNIHIYILKA